MKYNLNILFISMILFMFGFSKITLSESGNGYANPSFKNLSKTITMLSGVNILDNAVIDDYARIIYCDLYKQEFLDDFSWVKVRRAIREDVQNANNSFHRYYQVVGEVNLERYNFEEGYFPLTKESMLDKVGSMYIYEQVYNVPSCGHVGHLKSYAYFYSVNIDKPMTVKSIYLSRDKSVQLVDYLEEKNNLDRTIYIRFRIKLDKVIDIDGGEDVRKKALLSGSVEAVDFFADQELTMHIGSHDGVAKKINRRKRK